MLRTKAQHLREKLNDTKKLTMTADQYYTKMKGFASELSALGKPVGDDELLGYLLHGLDKVEYNSLITSVHGNLSTTIDDFYEQLCGYDMCNGVEENSMFVSSANLARRGYVPPCGRTPPPPSRGYSPPSLVVVVIAIVKVVVIAIVKVVVVVTATVSVMMTMVHGAEMMIAPGDVMIVVMMIAPGDVMTAVMMIAVVTTVMSAVIGAMMVVGVVTVYPPGMLTLNVKSARNMATLQMSAGGVILTRRKGMRLKKEHTLHPMGLTQIGMLTPVPLITLPAS
jgi:hypothetical protein